MTQSRDSHNTRAYIANKLKLAQNKREKLLDVINSLLQISIKNNAEIIKSGNGDIVKLINGELKQYYRIIRTHVEGVRGNLDYFSFILSFFDKVYLDENKIEGLARRLEQQLVLKGESGRTYNPGFAGYKGARTASRFSAGIEKVLTNWIHLIESIVDTLLRDYLSDVNEIVLYSCLKNAINRPDISIRDISHDDAGNKDCKKSFAFFFEILMKLNQKYLSDEEMGKMINQLLQKMGFKNIVMTSRSLNQDKYMTMISEIVNEVNSNKYIKKYTDSYHTALKKIREIENREYYN
jgi:hypothetical protein